MNRPSNLQERMMSQGVIIAVNNDDNRITERKQSIQESWNPWTYSRNSRAIVLNAFRILLSYSYSSLS